MQKRTFQVWSLGGFLLSIFNFLIFIFYFLFFLFFFIYFLFYFILFYFFIFFIFSFFLFFHFFIFYFFIFFDDVITHPLTHPSLFFLAIPPPTPPSFFSPCLAHPSRTLADAFRRFFDDDVIFGKYGRQYPMTSA